MVYKKVVSQNYQENTCDGDLFLINLYPEKFLKSLQKTPVAESRLNKIFRLKNFPKSTEKRICRSLVFKKAARNKVADLRHNIDKKALTHFSFFIALVIQSPSFLHHLNSVFLLITGKSSNCLLSANIIWDKVFKNGPSKICGGQPLKNLKGYGLLQA